MVWFLHICVFISGDTLSSYLLTHSKQYAAFRLTYKWWVIRCPMVRTTSWLVLSFCVSLYVLHIHDEKFVCIYQYSRMYSWILVIISLYVCIPNRRCCCPQMAIRLLLFKVVAFCCHEIHLLVCIFIHCIFMIILMPLLQTIQKSWTVSKTSSAPHLSTIESSPSSRR